MENRWTYFLCILFRRWCFVKKSALKKIPYSKAGKEFASTADYIGLAERKIVEHKLTLVLHVFHKVNSVYAPFLQLFCDKEEFLTIMKDGTYSVKSLDYLLQMKSFEIIKGEEIIKDYISSYFRKFPINTKEWNVAKYILSYQETIRREKLVEKKINKGQKKKWRYFLI